MPDDERRVEVLVLDSSDDDNDDDDNPAKPPRPSRPSRDAQSTGQARADDEFERELERAIQLSLAQPEPPRPRPTDTDASREAATQRRGTVLPSRAEMERERLERQRKRQLDPRGQSGATQSRPVSPTSSRDSFEPAPKRSRGTTVGDVDSVHAVESRPPPPPAGVGNPSSNSRFQRLRSSTASGVGLEPPSRSTSTTTEDHTTVRFWSGSIRRVPNLYHPDSTSLSFASLVGPRSTLVGAIVSAFCLDPTWVVPQFADDVPLLLIMPRAREDNFGQVAQVSVGTKVNCYRVVPEEKSPNFYAGVMHTKVMVYYHESFCRIVIPTANAVEYDWSHIDNAYYVQDFPLLPGPPPGDSANPFANPTHTQFSKNLTKVLVDHGAPKRFVSFLKNYDFARSRDVRLVHSLQGKYIEPEKFDQGGGLASLAKAVASLGFRSGGTWEIEATGSSIGRYTTTWLAQFLASCSGLHPTTYFTPCVSRPMSLWPSSLGIPSSKVHLTRETFPLKVVFPTHREVEESHNGIGGGGTIFCPTKNWNDPKFPKDLFWKGQSKRDKVAAHTKMLLAKHIPGPLDQSTTADPPVHEGYIYIGSHNLTPSAWGALQKGSEGPQLAVNNYELGVIVPIRARSDEDFEEKANALVTYKRPLVPYGSNDKPWMQDAFPEIFGQKEWKKASSSSSARK